MAAPVLVRAYPSDPTSPSDPPVASGKSAQALPPISAYTFAAILRSSDGPEFQQAIDGIAEICAKNRMSLADEYSSHLPPLGEITAANSGAVRPHLLRPGGIRRALTSVPEASSGSSEGSRKSRKRASGLFGFRRKEAQSQPMRQIRIGRMGRTISVSGTTAMAGNFGFAEDLDSKTHDATDNSGVQTRQVPDRRPSEAASSLQRLLSRAQNTQIT